MNLPTSDQTFLNTDNILYVYSTYLQRFTILDRSNNSPNIFANRSYFMIDVFLDKTIVYPGDVVATTASTRRHEFSLGINSIFKNGYDLSEQELLVILNRFKNLLIYQ